MITIQGNLGFNASINRAKKAFSKADLLSQFMNAESRVEQVDETNFIFVGVKGIGPTHVEMRGTLSVVMPLQSPDSLQIIAKGSHLTGGSVQIDLQIDFSGDTKHCQMSYLGEMKATGLMGKFLKSKADKVASRVDAALKELGRRLENNQRSYEARNPAAVNKAV